MLKTVLMLVVLTGIGAGVAPSALGGVQFYFNEGAWRAAVPMPEGLAFTAPNVGLAEETLPSQCLTFLSINTGLSRDFEICATEEKLHYSSAEPGLSPGGSSLVDDDWELNMPGGAPTYAFAAKILDNNETFELGEVFTVYGSGWEASKTSDEAGPVDWPHGWWGDQPFIGVVSTEPIERVAFNDETGIDNIAIGAVYFVPEPATFSLLALGSLAMIMRRRRPVRR